VELRDYLRVLRKRWTTIFVLTIAASAGAAAATWLSTPQYTSTTQLFVSTQATGTASDLLQGSNFTQQRVQSYADIVTSEVVLAPAIAALGESATTEELARQVTAEAPLDTVLINITATDPSPNHAADIANAVGASFIQAVEQLEQPSGAGSSPVLVSTVEPADIPTAPTSPNIPLNLVLGLLVGLGGGVVLAILRDSLDTRIRSAIDVQRVTPSPVLGSMPFDEEVETRTLAVTDAPRGAQAEAFRQLRTNLQFVTAARSIRSAVVTSAVEREGKTTTAMNLAVALASAGTRVALVDADLRRPMIAERLGIEGAVGLTTVLIGRASLKDVMQPWGGTGNVDVLAAGQTPPNPSELLATPAMEEVIHDLENSYDFVLFDGAPLLPVTDSAVLARSTGGALLVAASGRVTQPQLHRGVAALETAGAALLGVVLTMVPTRGPDAYSTYGYSYPSRANARASKFGKGSA